MYTAKSSLLKVLYFLSAGYSFLLKKPRGCGFQLTVDIMNVVHQCACTECLWWSRALEKKKELTVNSLWAMALDLWGLEIE